MLGPLTKLNGTIETAMEEAIIRRELLLMSVQTSQEHLKVQPLAGIDGVAMIQMVMAGQIKGIGSHTNQPNGGIWMAMDSEITPMDTKATLAPMREASLSLIVLDVEIQTAMAGQTPLKIG